MDYEWRLEQAKQKAEALVSTAESRYGDNFILMRPIIEAYIRALRDVRWNSTDLFLATCDLAYQELQCQKE